MKKILLSGMFFLSVPATYPESHTLYAAITVIDLTNLKQNTLTAIRTAEQIQNQLSMIRNQVRTLSTLPSSTYGQIKGLYDGNMQELNGLIGDVQGISFDLNQVNSQFDQLYPQGQWDSMNRSQYGDYFHKWNKELSDAAKIAMRAQTVLQRSEAYNNEAMSILDRSAVADGEVRQLQSTNQMLGIVSAQLSGLTENLSTSTRITATAAAEEAQRKEAAAAYSRKLLQGYGGHVTNNTGVQLPMIKQK